MSLSRADVVELYLERNISEQCATGNGAELIPQFVAATAFFLDDRPPSKFRREQLGMAEGEYPSILEVQRSVRKRNADHRDDARTSENDRIKALLAAAKKEQLRTFVRPVPVPRGCAGCASCVPDVRLSPLAAPVAELRAWLPRDPNGLGRHASATLERAHRRSLDAEHRANVRRLTQGQKDLRRLARVEARRAGAETKKPRRRSDGRPEMKKRRAAAKVMQDAARRTLDEA